MTIKAATSRVNVDSINKNRIRGDYSENSFKVHKPTSLLEARATQNRINPKTTTAKADKYETLKP